MNRVMRDSSSSSRVGRKIGGSSCSSKGSNCLGSAARRRQPPRAVVPPLRCISSDELRRMRERAAPTRETRAEALHELSKQRQERWVEAEAERSRLSELKEFNRSLRRKKQTPSHLLVDEEGGGRRAKTREIPKAPLTEEERVAKRQGEELQLRKSWRQQIKERERARSREEEEERFKYTLSGIMTLNIGGAGDEPERDSDDGGDFAVYPCPTKTTRKHAQAS